ncbi:MAG: hypothetical protein IPP19_14350 [Verrucomicrobia bacterium]|nr:hypothetical protein [Verrucomicrobiota bacterium]
MKTIQTEPHSTFNSHVHLQQTTRGPKESARALKRLAAAEETIARNIGELLRDDDDEAETPPPLPKQGVTPPKKQPRKK